MTTPSALSKVASQYFLDAQPPLLSEEGNPTVPNSVGMRNGLFSEAIPAALHLSAGYLALVRECQVALEDRFTQRWVHQFMDVQAHALPRVRRHVENSGIHPDRVFRAYLDAVPAIHADSRINVETDRILFDVGVRV